MKKSVSLNFAGVFAKDIIKRLLRDSDREIKLSERKGKRRHEREKARETEKESIE